VQGRRSYRPRKPPELRALQAACAAPSKRMRFERFLACGDLHCGFANLPKRAKGAQYLP
jgi:hypothetical protein